jgi:hypothetical protein
MGSPKNPETNAKIKAMAGVKKKFSVKTIANDITPHIPPMLGFIQPTLPVACLLFNWRRTQSVAGAAMVNKKNIKFWPRAMA